MQKALIFVGGLVAGTVGGILLSSAAIESLIHGNKSQKWIINKGDHFERWNVYETTGKIHSITFGFYDVVDPDYKYESKEETTDESDAGSADSSKASDES